MGCVPRLTCVCVWSLRMHACRRRKTTSLYCAAPTQTQHAHTHSALFHLLEANIPPRASSSPAPASSPTSTPSLSPHPSAQHAPVSLAGHQQNRRSRLVQSAWMGPLCWAGREFAVENWASFLWITADWRQQSFGHNAVLPRPPASSLHEDLHDISLSALPILLFSLLFCIFFFGRSVILPFIVVFPLIPVSYSPGVHLSRSLCSQCFGF